MPRSSNGTPHPPGVVFHPCLQPRSMVRAVFFIAVLLIFLPQVRPFRLGVDAAEEPSTTSTSLPLILIVQLSQSSVKAGWLGSQTHWLLESITPHHPERICLGGLCKLGQAPGELLDQIIDLGYRLSRTTASSIVLPQSSIAQTSITHISSTFHMYQFLTFVLE